MSIGRRAYDLLRGYVGTEWERIRDVERDWAEKELRTPPPASSVVLQTPNTPTLEGSSPVPSTPFPMMAHADRRERARRILGLPDVCAFEDIRKCFARLNKRSDPANFPAGSPEEVKAIEIHRKVNWAYAVLTEDMDRTERRFRTLELE